MKQDILNKILDKLNRRRNKHRITNIDILRDNTNAIRMNIDDKRFRIASLGWDQYMVEEVKEGILSSNDEALKISKELL